MDRAPSRRMPTPQDTFELYQHTRQRDWGLATPVSVRGPRVLYQFEDGKVREFRSRSPLLRRVRPSKSHSEAVAQLHAHLEALEGQRRQRSARKRVARGVPDVLSRQVRALHKKYPRGFRGTRWKVQVRGHGANKRLRRHREPAILGAQQRFAASIMRQLVDNKRHADVHRLAMEVLGSTDLVHRSRLRPLMALTESEEQRFAERLSALLHDKGEPFEVRFDRWVDACDVRRTQPPAWEIVTLPLALMYPREHICVRRESLLDQLKRLGVPLELPSRPDALAYRQALGVVRGIGDACMENELEPSDLLDVLDFLALPRG